MITGKLCTHYWKKFNEFEIDIDIINNFLSFHGIVSVKLEKNYEEILEEF